MSWSYDPDDLATNEVYQIRSELRDVDVTDQLLQDEEIQQAINVERNYWGAVARCAEMISRGLLRKADPRLGRSLYVVYSKAAQQYNDMACKLRKRAEGTVVPWVGGMTISDKLAYAENQSLVQPAFTRTMQENPRAGGYSSDSVEGVPGETDDFI